MFSLVHTATALTAGAAVVSLAEVVLVIVLLSTPISDRSLRWHAAGLAAVTVIWGWAVAMLGAGVRRYKPRGPGGVETSTPTTIPRAFWSKILSPMLLTLSYSFWVFLFSLYASSISECTRICNGATCNAVLYIGIALAVLYIICIVLFTVVLWNFYRNVREAPGEVYQRSEARSDRVDGPKSAARPSDSDGPSASELPAAPEHDGPSGSDLYRILRP